MRTFILGIAVLITCALAAEMDLIQPKDVAAQLTAKGAKPVVLYVGPNVLYRGKHIPGAIYAGPGAKPEGIELLKQAVAKLSKESQILLYCGCCPWGNCPNIKPAVAVLQDMGYTHVKAMYIENNFAKDWTEKGYPVQAGAAAQ